MHIYITFVLFFCLYCSFFFSTCINLPLGRSSYIVRFCCSSVLTKYTYDDHKTAKMFSKRVVLNYEKRRKSIFLV